MSSSPLNALASNRTTPATSICAAPDIAPLGNASRELQTEPNAQLADASNINIAPSGLPNKLLPVLSNIIPTNPRAIPDHSSLVLRIPHNILKHKVNNGTVATITAAIPEGTCWCSAMVTNPLPIANNKIPIALAPIHWRKVGRA
ncbi:Uncharacterised protein [Yersinia enterocolitica]|nr:Uncharacterised protein [Yersinia enterocolitica]